MLDSRNSKELNDMERLLSGLRPCQDGLDADAMLFAAGLAAGRQAKGKVLLSTMCGLLAVATAGLALWGLAQRKELIQLARHQQERMDDFRTIAVQRKSEPAPSIYEPSFDDYLSLRRAMEADPDSFVALHPAGNLRPGELPPPEAEILKTGQRGNILD
jgi:hypothetical protein